MPEVTYTLDRSSKVATFNIDTQGPVNTIGQRFIADLEQAVERAQQDLARGLMIVSAKKNSFLDGANLKEIVLDATPQAVGSITLRYQEALANIARSPFPVVAVMNGQTALGGGFELLLWACDHVICTAASRMGLPEISVGLFPAGGGTHTLPKVLGFKAALDALLTGRVASAQDYAHTGFVTICSSDELMTKAVSWLDSHQDAKNRNYDPAFQEPNPLSHQDKAQLLADARRRYGISPYRPYLIAVLDSMEAGMKLSLDAAAQNDLDLFTPLFSNRNSRNKIDLFFLSTSLAQRLAKVDASRAVSVDSVAIIGSGLMGRGIAQVAADKGIKTLLIDVDDATAQDGVVKIEAAAQELVTKGKWSEKRKAAVMANISSTTDYSRLVGIPLVIECVFEDLALKRSILARVQDVNPGAIFASNTSTIPMADISEGAISPEQVVGMHFFSPVPLMPLLEVIEGPSSSQEAVSTAVTVGRAIGKTVILVGDGPGFYTSRTFGTYVMSGFRLAELGMSPWEVDLLALKCGFPQGPLHVYGTAGGRVIFHAGTFMANRFPDRMSIPPSLARMYEADFVGAGRPCFYLDERKMIPNQAALDHIVRAEGLPVPTQEEAADILLLAMANEAFWCLSEDVLRDYHSMDLGAVLGIGFPDCWHGPGRYVSLRGVRTVQSRLNELAEKFRMPGLKPAPEFDRLVACGLDSHII